MKELEQLGLNKLEADVYLALQELGEAKVGSICKKLNLPNSHMYPTLNKLKKKGLVSYKLANKIKIYKATAPDTLKQLFEDKKQKLQEQETQLLSFIDELKKLPKNKETDSDYQYFEGAKAVKAMIKEAYETAQKNSEMKLISAVSESWDMLNAFFLDMHAIRIKRGINLKMIMQEHTIQLQKRIEERKKIGLIEIHLANFSNHGELFLTEKYVIILDTSTQTKTPCGFMIQNKVFLAMFSQFFDYIWDSTKQT